MALRSELHTISICTGGGGLDFGLELAVPSARSVCMVEREAFGAARLASAMEDGLLAPAPVWSDARTFNGRPWRGCVDGLVGGIPCQPHSVAGKRRGQADERDLWSIARRIVVQSGAWFVLIENVGGMLSSSDPDLRPGAERVWRDLQRLGFAVEGGLFTAAEVGAPHERERVFILGVADAGRTGHQGRELCGPSAEVVGLAASRSASELRGARLGYADREREQQPHDADGTIAREGSWDRSGGASLRLQSAMVDASRRGRAGRSEGQVGRPIDGAAAERASGSADALHVAYSGDARPSRTGSQPQHQSAERQLGDCGGAPSWPPRPNDLDGWRDLLTIRPEVEPAVRGDAHGLASRVDQLRMLGNGVVPLAAAHAIRTLAHRLSRRSPGAAELVRLMGGLSQDIAA